jgi:tripartite-type tricarboxylate transporter receptor subunit TctC
MHAMFRMNLFAVSLLIVMTGLLEGATAQVWPAKPIKIIESFPPGIARDHRTRVIAEKLSAALGQQVYVENRPGAAGRLAGQSGAAAAPDGYTFNMMGTTEILTKHLFHLSYDIERDLVPVTMIEKVPGALIGRASLPARNLTDLIHYAREHPNALTYGSTGAGGWLHVNALLFSNITNTSLQHVPYSQGSLTTDLLGDHLDLVFDSVPPYLENVKAGRLRALALTGEHRAGILPDVPTFIESGVPAYDVYALYGLLAPRGLSERIISKMQETIWQILQDQNLRRQWTEEGGNPVGSTPAEFAAHIRSESERWRSVIRQNKITVE